MRYIKKAKIIDNLSQINKNDYIVLKSDAYGFGLKKIIEILAAQSFKKFATIEVETAKIIRYYIPRAKILLIAPFDIKLIEEYQKYDIELSINSYDDITYLINKNISVQIAINSGMNRFGIRIDEVKKVHKALLDNKIGLSGIYTHNAGSNLRIIYQQLNYFKECLDLIERDNLDIHFQATQLMKNDISFCNCRRIGAYLFFDCFTVTGKIVAINKVLKNETIGYDYYHKMINDGLIGVIDIGYADGIVRRCQGYEVYIRGKMYPLISKACMNHTFVLLDETIKIGDEVEIIGPHCPLYNYLNFFSIAAHEAFISFGLSPGIYI